MKVLISDPDNTWVKNVQEHFRSSPIETEVALNGKECQLKTFQNPYAVLLLDLDTKAHSGIEVLRYMRLNQGRVKVILSFSSRQRFETCGLSEKEFRMLGANDILIKPYSLQALQKSIEGDSQFEAWRQIKTSDEVHAEEEISARDSEFTRIPIDTFQSGHTTIFDHYIRISANKFLKILHKGDAFDKARLQKYAAEKKVDYLYFKTRDRGLYINFMNETLEKLINNQDVSSDLKVKATKSVTEKYIEEIYTHGIQPQLIDEGKKLCESMYQLVTRVPDLAKALREFEDYDPPVYTHLFLTSFFSTIISRNLEWTSARTTETAALGSLLHDIGMLKLPVELRQVGATMTPQQRLVYETHPL